MVLNGQDIYLLDRERRLIAYLEILKDRAIPTGVGLSQRSVLGLGFPEVYKVHYTDYPFEDSPTF